MNRRVRLLTFSHLSINCAACLGGDPRHTVVELDQLAWRATVFENHYVQDWPESDLQLSLATLAAENRAVPEPVQVSWLAQPPRLSDEQLQAVREAEFGWLHVQLPASAADTTRPITDAVDSTVRSRVAAAVTAILDCCEDQDALLVTATAAPSVGDTGRFESLLPEMLIRVPLLIAVGRQQARRVRSPTGSHDLLATIAELRAGLQGSSDEQQEGPVGLLQLSQRTPPPAERRLRIQAQQARAIRTSRFLYVEQLTELQPDVPEVTATALYVKPEDVWNVNDISVEYPDTVEELQSLLAGSPGRGI